MFDINHGAAVYVIKPQREYIRFAVTSTFGDYIRFAITYKACGLDKTKKEHGCCLGSCTGISPLANIRTLYA